MSNSDIAISSLTLEKALTLQAQLQSQIDQYEKEKSQLETVLGRSKPVGDTLPVYGEELPTEETVTQYGELVAQCDELSAENRYFKILIQLKELEKQTDQNDSLVILSSLRQQTSHVINSLISDHDGAIRHQEAVHAYAVQVSDKLDTRTQLIVARDLRQALDSIAWPAPKAATNEKFVAAFASALALYDVEEDLPSVLNIFAALTEPLQARFLFHFDSKRPTNRLDKPEWFLQHVIALTEQHNTFLLETIQPILTQSLPGKRLYAPHEFIRALLPMLSTKLIQNGALLLDDTELLRHTITETKKFDDTLRFDLEFRNRNLTRWSGICASLLSDTIFGSWISSEDEFVKQRYHAIVDEDEAFEISNEVESEGCEIAANPSALKLIDLFEAMTRQFSPVDSVKQRRLFVETIQEALLNSYLAKVKTSTDAFDELANGFSGGFPAADVAGKAGLQRLCRQLSGVSNVHDKIKDWMNEPFYVELDDEYEREHCFSEVMQDYLKLRLRIEGLIVGHLHHELTQELRPYTRLHTWSSDESPSTKIATANASSSQLIKFYETTTDFFSYLVTICSPVLLHRLYIALARKLDLHLWTNVVCKNKFSRRGALQFKRDVLQMWFTFSPFVSRPEPGTRRMADVLTILSDGSDEQEKETLRKVRAANDIRSLRSAGVLALDVQEVRFVLATKQFRDA